MVGVEAGVVIVGVESALVILDADFGQLDIVFSIRVLTILLRI